MPAPSAYWETALRTLGRGEGGGQQPRQRTAQADPNAPVLVDNTRMIAQPGRFLRNWIARFPLLASPFVAIIPLYRSHERIRLQFLAFFFIELPIVIAVANRELLAQKATRMGRHFAVDRGEGGQRPPRGGLLTRRECFARLSFGPRSWLAALSDNHQVRLVDADDHPAPVARASDPVIAQRATLSEQLDRWLAACGRNSDQPMIALVATAGGASRAALWAASVMHQEEQAVGVARFRQALFSMSGVSGSLGAAAYVASLPADYSNRPAPGASAAGPSAEEAKRAEAWSSSAGVASRPRSPPTFLRHRSQPISRPTSPRGSFRHFYCPPTSPTARQLSRNPGSRSSTARGTAAMARESCRTPVRWISRSRRCGAARRQVGGCLCFGEQFCPPKPKPGIGVQD